MKFDYNYFIEFDFDGNKVKSLTKKNFLNHKMFNNNFEFKNKNTNTNRNKLMQHLCLCCFNISVSRLFSEQTKKRVSGSIIYIMANSINIHFEFGLEFEKGRACMVYCIRRYSKRGANIVLSVENYIFAT